MQKGVLVLTRTLGDVVLANVLANNIKLAYPDLTLDYVVEECYAPLVKHNPNISAIKTIKSTVQNWDDVLAICSNPYYDHVFVPQQTTGYDNNWHQITQSRHQHLIDFYAQRCNITLVDRKLVVFTDSVDKVENTDRKCTIAIHNKTLADVKDWSYFDELVRMLHLAGYSIVQLGNGSEPTVEGSEKLSMSLEQIIRFFAQKKCDVFIGLDSGLSYLAAALNIQVVCIQGATIPTTSGPYGENVHTLLSQHTDECKKERKGVRCHGILGGRCAYKSKCIDTITAFQVFEKVLEVLSHGKNGDK